MLTIVTTAASYPNPYTRIDASSMIAELVQECNPLTESTLCAYVAVVSKSCRNFLVQLLCTIFLCHLKIEERRVQMMFSNFRKRFFVFCKMKQKSVR